MGVSWSGESGQFLCKHLSLLLPEIQPTKLAQEHHSLDAMLGEKKQAPPNQLHTKWPTYV
jgi:hypothetical protein